MTDFDRAMEFVSRWEGGFVDHPDDPGGATNMGVTQRTYDDWRKSIGARLRDVKKLDKVERDAIYRQRYWQAAGCDDLPWPLSLVQFDTAVNTGVSRAIQFLRASDKNVPAYLEMRRTRYHRLAEVNPKLLVFLRGWMNRVTALEVACSRS